MPVPDFQSIMLPLLECLSDGQEHTSKEIIEMCAEKFKLTREEREELVPSRKQRKFDNRVYWAQTYLKKSGIISSPSRGIMIITDRGREILNKKPKRIDMKYLEKFPEYLEFKSINQDVKKQSDIKSIKEEELTPSEILERSYNEIRNAVSIELLEMIKNRPPEFFEKLVVDLLLAMGYGGSRKDAGRATRKTADDGIDGIINEDKLGLDIVAIQAKRWENTVGRPHLQAFVGSLAGNRAKKGVFITTSRFSKDAYDYIRRIEQKIILIDGEQLAKYMIDYNVGVSEEEIYIIKKVDYDYFEDI